MSTKHFVSAFTVFALLFLFAFPTLSSPNTNTTRNHDSDKIILIAERMLRGETVSPEEKAAAYETFLRLRGEQQQPPSTMRTGGPDSYGYSFIDNNSPTGPVFNWLTNTGTNIAGTVSGGTPDDGYYGPYSLGFTFNFYGTPYTQFYIGTNGYISFSNGYSQIPIFGTWPESGYPEGIFFWGRDLHAGYGGTVIRYQLQTMGGNALNHVMVVDIDSISAYNTSGSARVSCQVEIFQDGHILLQYRNYQGGMNTTYPGNIGIQSAGGATGNLAYCTTSGNVPAANSAVMFLLPVFGTKTIGGANADFPSFLAAIQQLNGYGVGTGGVTFLVRPGIYSEMVSVPPVTGMGASNPVVFRNDSTQAGTVQISPQVPGAGYWCIVLNGCQYVTFNGINIIDTTTGTYPIQYGVYTTNTSAVQGAQHNWIKNATIRLRINSTYETDGINQVCSVNPTASSGAQSDNHYINLKISKVRIGINNISNGTYPDAGIEIGSDSVGVNYSKRFVIGALGTSDTIGGEGWARGIEIQSTNGINIHDIDVNNLMTYNGSYPINGIVIFSPLIISNPNVIKNNRIYNLNTVYSSSFNDVFGIYFENGNNYPFKVYNNMVYGLHSIAPSAVPTSVNYVTGIEAYNGYADIDHNTVLIDDGGYPNCRNYSSIAIAAVNANDTLRNNIIANYTGNGTGTSYHVGFYLYNLSSWWSNYNCYDIPNSTTNGYVCSLAGNNYSTLANWQAASGGPDANSVYGDPHFVSATSPYDLHLQTYQLNTVTDQTGVPAGIHSPGYITADIDGEPRQARADIGAAEGQFAAIPVNFAGTKPHQSDSLYVAIKSPATNNFHYSSVTNSSSNFTNRVVNVSSPVVTGDSLRLWIRFAPDSTVTFTDTLCITFQAPNAAIQIPLTGLGLGSYVTLPGSSMSFPGSLAPGQNTSLNLSIFVQGNHSLDNSHWITIPPTAPFYVVPGTMPTVSVGSMYTTFLFFAPTTTGNFTAQVGLVSNAVNGDTLKLTVTGFSQNMPVAPGLTITVNGDNALLNWTRPDTTVLRYLVYFRNSAAITWQFLANTIGYNATSFTHAGVIRFSPQMYYQVTAYYGGSSSDSFDRIIRTIPVGTPMAEVTRRLNEEDFQQSKPMQTIRR